MRTQLKFFISFPLAFFLLGLFAGYFAEAASNNSVKQASRSLVVGVPLSIPLTSDARDVVVGDPGLVDTLITSGRVLVVTGKAQGVTSLAVIDHGGQTLETISIRIDANLDELNEILSQDLGLKSVRIRSTRQALVVTGSVASASDASKVDDVLRAYFDLGTKSDGGAASVRIVNTLKIVEREQVMLRVVVSEVQRSLLKQLGVDTQGNWKIGNFSLANAVTFPSSRTPTTSIAPEFDSGDNSGSITLKALERAGYLKTLAEPTLTAISGESAKFTAGGEIPVPTGIVCSNSALGTQNCQASYGYKPIGVSLSFTPVVLNAGRISLQVSTEVTDIDPDNGSRTSTGNIPAFRSRKMETTVELASGATLMSAGLIQNQSSSTYDRVPGLAAVPILGELFQSNDYQNFQTELLISVVPFIAKPLPAPDAASLDETFQPAADQSIRLTEEINNLYRLRAKPGIGRFGFEVK